jgi:hypothetical protein
MPAPTPFYPAAAVARLHGDLAALQAPADCASARALVLVFGEESGINGFSAMFQFAAAALAVARALNRTLVEALPAPGGGGDAWPRAPPLYCGGLKLGCYFEPLSRCGALGWDVGALPEVAPTLAAALAQGGVPSLRLSRLGPAHALLFEATRGRGSGGVAPWWAAAVGPHGCVYEGGRADAAACAARLWFPAVQTFLFRPLPRVRALAAGAVAELGAAAAGAGGGCAFALHVRRGDAAALHWRANASLPHYLAVARLALPRGGGAPPPLYLATDSAEVKAAAEALAAPAFRLLASPARVLVARVGDAGVHTETFIAAALAEVGGGVSDAAAAAATSLPPLPAVLSPLDAPGAASLLLPAAAAALRGDGAAYLSAASDAAGDAAARAAADVAALTEGVVADVWALSHGTHFVGTCLSQVSRLAYELAYGAGRARAPPVGVDALACRAHARHFMAITADWRDSFDTWVDA